MEGVSARVVGEVVLGSEGVVEGRDVMVVVVLVVEDCVEEGIFLKCLVGERRLGEQYSMVFYVLGRDGLGGDIYVYSGGYGLYIYLTYI